MSQEPRLGWRPGKGRLAKPSLQHAGGADSRRGGPRRPGVRGRLTHGEETNRARVSHHLTSIFTRKKQQGKILRVKHSHCGCELSEYISNRHQQRKQKERKGE